MPLAGWSAAGVCAGEGSVVVPALFSAVEVPALPALAWPLVVPWPEDAFVEAAVPDVLSPVAELSEAELFVLLVL